MIGQKIKVLRQNKGYSISQLAVKARVSKSYLSNLENNKKNNPSIIVLSRIATTLDSTVDELIAGEDLEKAMIDDEWIELLQKGVNSGMSKKEFTEFQIYLQYRRDQV
ncbi:helix-turn-helix domain-containing protein [Jeotgalibacillus salarius]|uniref:Helix-turn-helix domain-containing protein n=1 Tax=Jeotgalibacillus salarius TaxID=546023 RepID=A0A4Y8LLX0_9BACL|nr:helix-turn-helix domain-containing protein [Jeotgalibacillus salarius]TFE01725.1 helix-turn-helix domain-containing protein [Jeotgalibacillus salarius]